VNGLGFEGWIDRLIKASGTKAPVVVASKGVKPRRMEDDDHGHGKADPHAWQSIANAKMYVANIRDALAKADPARKATYEANAAAYVANLDALEADVKAAVAAIPATRRKVITTHDSFGYFAAAYGMQFIAPQGVSTEAEVSARLIRRIAEETGAKVGGKLYSDALSAADGPAPTYIDLMRNNLKEFRAAL
jgi:zinc/manganese transport system substrate-binding protein